MKTINEIKELLSNEVNLEVLLELEQDKRAGVKKLLESYYKKEEKKNILKEEYKKRTTYEKKCYSLGYNNICGIDEVGRGPLAGPVVAAGVILKKDSYFPGLTDSKKLSAKKREELYNDIINNAVAYSIVELDNFEIEKHNIYQATKIAMKKVVENIATKPDFLLIDAMPLDIDGVESLSIVKGDEKSVSIAAASILAKVYRDRLMEKYDEIYPYYDFKNNMGYGTKKHLEGLKQYGICDIHRRNFEPIKTIIKKDKFNEK
ncbi:ribonuclease HII [Gemelliphila palaticanis]|uniref:Ribonuclease HII n=1 Tax=Gemelliphila palaticanis TaxID=81950 RepID=A0ABX2SYL8_9BACL|nr:ribonuclease HII [Gemella palaticanis]MBF0715502.1 ribonuclease HII [Gemella palaticanis]NYS47432.1 ribonuclease HII [Gemella palaticanis]